MERVPIIEGYRRCAECKSLCPVDRFNIRADRANGALRSQCKDCVNRGQREQRRQRGLGKGGARRKPYADGLKHCSACSAYRPPEMFGESNRTWDKRKAHCRYCVTRGMAASRERRNVRNPATRLKERARRYGLSVEAYQALFCAQDGRCAICAEVLDREMSHIDHCHATGKVRGILCRSCNHGLGNFRATIQRFLEPLLNICKEIPNRNGNARSIDIEQMRVCVKRERCGTLVADDNYLCRSVRIVVAGQMTRGGSRSKPFYELIRGRLDIGYRRRISQRRARSDALCQHGIAIGLTRFEPTTP
ncbi:MAG: endonuclease VII domain-containing protein [Vulcanimicrobiaceae bacterium]